MKPTHWAPNFPPRLYPFTLVTHHPTQHTSTPSHTGLLTQREPWGHHQSLDTWGSQPHITQWTGWQALGREDGKRGGSSPPGSCPRQSKPRQSHGTLRALWLLGCTQEEGGVFFPVWPVHGAGGQKSAGSLVSLITLQRSVSPKEKEEV